MYFRHWLFHVKQQHCKQSTSSITLEWTIQICSTVLNTHCNPPSLFLPPSLHISSSLPYLPTSLLPYVSLLLALFLLFSLPPSFVLFLFFPLSLSSTPSLFLHQILFPPFLFFSPSILPHFFSTCILSLNPTLHDTSYIPLSSSPSLFWPPTFFPFLS